MTIKEQQAAILMRAMSRKGKNQYTQGSKRLQVASGYSDCSSFVRWAILVVSGVDIGLNTDAQVVDKDLTTVHKGGKAPDVSLLQVGDLVYFIGNSAHTYGVQHVEMVTVVGKTIGDCQTIGHSSGLGPTVKNLKTYLDSRAAAGRGYLMTRRPILAAKTWVLGDRELSLGSYGEDVGTLQALLVQKGYSIGESGADMDFGPDTRAAVKAFQQDSGLEADGIVGSKTLAALQKNTPIPPDTRTLGDRELSLGSYGEDVGVLQTLLVQKGYSIGKSGVDMDFGPDTLAAVKAFQKDNGLDVDGIVGPKTVAALQKNTPTPPDDTADGCDISHHDGTVEWAKVTAPYVFIRVQDNTVLDRQLSANVKGAEKYAVPYGHYAFFEATTASEARAEVQLFVQRMKDVNSNPSCLVLDVELDKNTASAVKAGLDELKTLWPDVQHGIYIAHQLYDKFKSIIPLFDMVWIPRYNSWKTPPAYPYDLWQGGYGSFSGIQSGKSAVDCNRLRPGLTWSQLIALRAK